MIKCNMIEVKYNIDSNNDYFIRTINDDNNDTYVHLIQTTTTSTRPSI